MKRYISVLKSTSLFAGVSESEISAMLDCLQAKLCAYKKGEYVLHRGDKIDDIMVLVEGRLYIQNDDYWGNRSIVNMIEAGDMFGEAYAGAENERLMNDVIAHKDSKVILLNTKDSDNMYIGMYVSFHCCTESCICNFGKEQKTRPEAWPYVKTDNT